MGHHMPCLPVEVELASQGVPYAMWAMQHYGAPHALLATFVSPKNHSSSCSSLSSTKFIKTVLSFSRTLHPLRRLRSPGHQEQSFAIKEPLFVFTSPCICATLHPDAERTIRHPRNNKTTYDPQSCLTARINVTLMIRLVLNGSSFFPDRSCPNRHPHAEPDAESAVYEQMCAHQ